MTDLARVRIALTGWDGAPGVITEHYSQGSLGGWDEGAIQDLVDEVHDRYSVQSDTFAPPVYATVDPSVGIFDVATGDLVDVIVAPEPPAPVGSSGSGGDLSRATMAGVRLLTSDFRNGRRVQGRLFWGPICSDMFTAGGTIKDEKRASLVGAFAASISGLGPRLAVWSRPRSGGTIPGDWADVTTVQVASKPFVLRSRRD